MSNATLSTVERVSASIATISGLPVEQITPESTFESLGLDSLDAVELLLDIETTFNIEIEDADYENAKTVSDLVALVESAVNVRQRHEADAGCCGACSGPCADDAPEQPVEEDQTLRQANAALQLMAADLQTANQLIMIALKKLGGSMVVSKDDFLESVGASVHGVGNQETGDYTMTLIAAPAEAG
ncbi:MAG TPA: acyl carrier protein [Gallionella sp.]|nr:acyl carrier protein [Gallionella sp.]